LRNNIKWKKDSFKQRMPLAIAGKVAFINKGYIYDEEKE